MTESMAETPDYDIEITGVIDAPRERVYEARWVDFPSRASFDLADPAKSRGPNNTDPLSITFAAPRRSNATSDPEPVDGGRRNGQSGPPPVVYDDDNPMPTEPIEVDLRVGRAWRQQMVIDRRTAQGALRAARREAPRERGSRCSRSPE
jgi:hypothetical protein